MGSLIASKIVCELQFSVKAAAYYIYVFFNNRDETDEKGCECGDIIKNIYPAYHWYT